jgi:L-lactate dehydrogenase
MEAVFSDAKTVFPLSIPLDEFYGHADVCLSVPCVLGINGVERVLHLELSQDEQANLSKSIDVLKQYSISSL